jgi:TolA-binding protein
MGNNLMDGLQIQINDLNNKVDQLHGIVERLSNQISVLTTQEKPQSDTKVEQLATLAWQGTSMAASYGRFQSYMEHKDVLVDDSEGANSSFGNGEQSLSADIQIRRLTAQLTAAYNRIAALEEQLLASRSRMFS